MNKLNNYILINTNTQEKSKKISKLTEWECRTFNYAYALNSCPLKYIKIKP